MGFLKKRLARSRTIKSKLVSILAVLFFSISNSWAGGVSEENRANFLSSLSNYETADKSRKASTQEISKEKQDFICEQEGNFPYTKECLERKYMSEGYFKVSMTFRVNHTPTEILPATFPNESWAFKGEDLEAFLNKWSDPVLSEYLGSDYRKFHEAELASLNNKYVRIKLLISDASEMLSIVEDHRLVGMTHIGIPTSPLEEIAN